MNEHAVISVVVLDEGVFPTTIPMGVSLVSKAFVVCSKLRCMIGMMDYGQYRLSMIEQEHARTRGRTHTYYKEDDQRMSN